MNVYIYGSFQEEKLPFSFYISDKELAVPLGTWRKTKVSQTRLTVEVSRFSC